MRRIKEMLGALALSGLALSIPGTALASGTAQAGGSGVGGGDSSCRIVVKRNASAGVFDVTRQLMKNDRCICRVSTGPRSQGGSAESALASLLLRRSCSDAPLATAGAAGGMSTGLIVGGVVVAGGAAALAASGSSSP